jgi:hypothetical protein
LSKYLIHNPEPVDHRDLTTATVRFLPDAHRYLDFNRQVVPTTRPPYDPNNENYDYEDDFDDVAVQMSITLIFEQADPNERGANMWIRQPEELEKGIENSCKRHLCRSICVNQLKLYQLMLAVVGRGESFCKLWCRPKTSE